MACYYLYYPVLEGGGDKSVSKKSTQKTFSAFDRVFFHSIFTNFTVAGPIVTDKEFFPVIALVFSSYSSNFRTVPISTTVLDLEISTKFLLLLTY